MFQIPPLEHCKSLDHLTPIDLAAVWTYEFDSVDGRQPSIQRLLDIPSHLNNASVLTWNQGRHHFLVTLPADPDPPSVVRLPSLAFAYSYTDRTARFRAVMPHRYRHDLTLVTNDAGNDTAHLVEVDFISQLQHLIPEDESFEISMMDMDEGTGRVCCVFRRGYKRGTRESQTRALTNFFVLLDFMVE